jgi:hypothetical protein
MNITVSNTQGRLAEVSQREDGVFAWAPTGFPVPLDSCQEYGLAALSCYDEAAQTRAVRRENGEVMRRHRELHGSVGRSREEAAEVRAAFWRVAAGRGFTA